MAVGVDPHPRQAVGLLAGQRVELGDRFDLVAEQRQPPRAVLEMRREDLDPVATHPEGAADKIGIVAAILQLDQLLEQQSAVDLAAGLQIDDHLRVGLDRADAVNARHAGDNDHVVAFEQRASRGVAHAVDLLVDRGVFFDVGVGARHIGLGLVIVVVRDEIIHRIVRKKALHLAVELRRQGLVGGEDQGRPRHRLSDVGHGKRLARAGDPEQDLIALAVLQPADQLGDRRRLIARRLEVRHHAKRRTAWRGARGFFQHIRHRSNIGHAGGGCNGVGRCRRCR